MYSIGPIPRQKRSGHVIGTHQKIDRVARRHLKVIADKSDIIFPSITDILHFEGTRGPDGLKLKSPNTDEPTHFIDPKNPEGELLDWIRHHKNNLIEALVGHDQTKAAFEAAWLAHAVVDGLTPAHQEPYLEQIKDLKQLDIDKQQRLLSKIMMSGESRRKFIENNWKYWGAKGIMTTHTLFEAGVAIAAKPYRFETGLPSHDEAKHVLDEGFESAYMRLLAEVASLDMYENFKKTGWTSQLARQTNYELLPRVIMAVVLAWYDAYMQAVNKQ